jgi:hypothetical protein
MFGADAGRTRIMIGAVKRHFTENIPSIPQ